MNNKNNKKNSMTPKIVNFAPLVWIKEENNKTIHAEQIHKNIDKKIYIYEMNKFHPRPKLHI